MLNTSLLEDDNHKDSIWNVSSLYAAPHAFLHLLTVAIPSWIHNSFSTSEYRPRPYHFLPPSMAESSIAMLLTVSIKSGPLGILFWPRTTRDCMTDAGDQPFHFMCHVGVDLGVDAIIMDWCAKQLTRITAVLYSQLVRLEQNLAGFVFYASDDQWTEHWFDYSHH